MYGWYQRLSILLHGFQKKTQKTPKKEIELAEKRRKEFLAQEKLNNSNDTKLKKKRRRK
ncbi:MAG: type II toxin-antitoxin system RelE/ParE family toxin [Xenococcaceae cyanobacterium MO_167.B27]|nr:type II toxin-antitoxin system RelE/ParE family toxin [Xenococcaceae cyanobacterium MO_167.B27]